MNTSSNSKALCYLAVLCAALRRAGARGRLRARRRGAGGRSRSLSLDAPLAGVNWIDHFDTYVTGSQMHLQGGWKGWDNSPGAGALTSSTQARSPLNSVDVLGGTDLVHEYTGYTTGTWTYTAWQYIPTGMTGNQYFILLNTYADGGHQQLVDPGLLQQHDRHRRRRHSRRLLDRLDRQHRLRPVGRAPRGDRSRRQHPDLLLQRPAGLLGHLDRATSAAAASLNIAAVDLFANGSTSVFYDDISLSNMPFVDGFENETTSEWHLTVP